MAPTGAQNIVASSTPPQPPPQETWTERTASTSASPRNLAKSVDADERAHIVVTRNVNGRPVITTTRVRGKAGAISEISRNQSDGSTLAVEVDQKIQILAASVGGPTAMTTANDTYRPSQWALDTLRAETAWGISQGAGTTVAVIDTGTAAVPDLAAQLVTGIDYVTSGNGTADPNGHGTHVAGIIAAIANNNVGVAGLGPSTKIMPVRVLDENGYRSLSVLANGIYWATNSGASILNLSLGFSESFTTIQTAVNYALTQGKVVVAAAGNSGDNTISYPAYYPGVIGVAATNSSNAWAAFSSSNDRVSVAAPGVDIASTVPGGYSSLSGTSMATPYVAATAALLLSRASALGQSLSPSAVTSILQSTATDLLTAGRDNKTGYGLINPVAALSSLAGAPTQLSLSLSSLPRRIKSGAAITISARATTNAQPAAGAAIGLNTITRLGVVVSTVATTDASGNVSWIIRPTRHFTVTATGSYSGATATASLGYWVLAQSHVRLVRYKGRVAAIITTADGQRVKLQNMSGKKWKTASKRSLGTSGGVVFATKRGATYRIVVSNTRDQLGTTTRKFRGL